uniref:Ig-like domain-containing protein n=1 Tax=Astatotilapia calliptera TaxID=8154 RepID=A0A3P8P0P9_ASTCA
MRYTLVGSTTKFLEKTITAESGQDVILPCRAPNNNIFTLEWERADLKSGNVLFRVGCDIILDDQHPSFKNRVDLQDKEMKDGDVSLILKDVTINDAGTYECHFLMVEARSFKHSFIKLVVVPPGEAASWLLMFVCCMDELVDVRGRQMFLQLLSLWLTLIIKHRNKTSSEHNKGLLKKEY